MRKSRITIEVIGNENDKTFSIFKKDNGEVYAEYLTIPFSEQEYEDAEYWTENDWKQFLATNDYTVVM